MRWLRATRAMTDAQLPYPLIELPLEGSAECVLDAPAGDDQQLRITRDGETPDTAGKSAGKKPFAKKAFGGDKKEFGPRKFGDKPPFKKPHRKGPPTA